MGVAPRCGCGQGAELASCAYKSHARMVHTQVRVWFLSLVQQPLGEQVFLELLSRQSDPQNISKRTHCSISTLESRYLERARNWLVGVAMTLYILWVWPDQ